MQKEIFRSLIFWQLNLVRKSPELFETPSISMSSKEYEHNLESILFQVSKMDQKELTETFDLFLEEIHYAFTKSKTKLPIDNSHPS